MRRLSLFAISFVLALVAATGCDRASGRNNNGGGGGNGGNGGNGGTGGGGGTQYSGPISIAPTDVTLKLVQGQAPPTQQFTVTVHDPSSGDHDVTGACTYALADKTLGTVSNGLFTAGTAHGGSTVLTATYGMQTATANIHVLVTATLPGPDCTTGCNPLPDNPPACAGGTPVPKIYYPPDGALLPPNMNKMSVQWTPFNGAGIQYFQINFSNAATNVKVLSKCSTELKDTTGGGTGGCDLELDQSMWDFIAKSNRGGDPVQITILATTDGSCGTPSGANVNVSFAEQDLNGGVFYWKSATAQTTNTGVGGQIWAQSFGSTLPEEQITGRKATNYVNLGAGCHGCHSLSRDGKVMTLNFDDDDSDDEYGDTSSAEVDVKTKTAWGISNTRNLSGQEPGFQTFNPDHSIYIGSDGRQLQNQVYAFDATNGNMYSPSAFMPIAPMNIAPTMLDWGPEGTNSVVFVVPKSYPSWGGQSNDDHEFGGSLYTIGWDKTKHQFQSPQALLTSAGENNYYPTYSPDGMFIAFNRVNGAQSCSSHQTQDGSGNIAQTDACPGDSFANPDARVFVMSLANKSPIDLMKANSTGSLSNSWPRWTPFVQKYKGKDLLWLTFSSIRDYGLRVRNHQPSSLYCYPGDSLENTQGGHGVGFPQGCLQPQIWMAAIDLSALQSGQDPSFTAFWMPYQSEIDGQNPNHNHTAQWTQTVVTQPQPDMGTSCIPDKGDCTANPNACCAPDHCSSNGTCQPPIP